MHNNFKNCLVHPPLYFSKLDGARVSGTSQPFFEGSKCRHGKHIVMLNFTKRTAAAKQGRVSLYAELFQHLMFVQFRNKEIPKPVRNDKLYNAPHCKSKCAFTLAEVLITLTIIGVIAALTIPNLMKNYQTHIFKTAYKQAYSDINQAFAQAFKDGELIRTAYYQTDASIQELNILKQKLKVSKECKQGDIFSCWAKGDTICGGTCSGAGYDENGKEIIATGQPETGKAPSFIDASGRSWTLFSNTQAHILVDTNGFKGPNKFGQDRFQFYPYTAQNTPTGNYSTNPPVRYGPYPNNNVTYRTWNCKFPPCYYYDWLYK